MEDPSVEVTVTELISNNKVVIFSKNVCPFCQNVKDLFSTLNESFVAVELDSHTNGEQIVEFLTEMTKQSTVPLVFVNGIHVGGCEATRQAFFRGTLFDMLEGTYKEYEYDLVVIGGGSGGLSAVNEAASYGRKVAVCDFVKPSPRGTVWGLGGTCVNVGCIPKMLMHRASLLGCDMKDAKVFGWTLSDEPNHDWQKLVTEIQSFIKSLNFKYRVELRSKKIRYYNAYATFINNHEIEVRNAKDEVEHITAQNFIIAVGGRPYYPDIPGLRQYAITSDDLFSLDYHPGKTLIVGGSYIALECAGFLTGLNTTVTVMVRSILLRGFDRQMSEMVGDQLVSEGVEFIYQCVLISIEKLQDGTPPILLVKAKKDENVIEGEYNTVLVATGRIPLLKDVGLENTDVELNVSSGKIIVDQYDKTSARNIFAIGDVADGKPELTPVAVQAGRYLCRRLFGNSETKTDYTNIPTTVFTPLEYGCVGLSEELAFCRYGKENVEVYHSFFSPLEYSLTNRNVGRPYAKMVCLKDKKNRVVGLHIFGPNAGEITQGYALGLKLGATLEDFQNLIGIHPTSAEAIRSLEHSKSSGVDVANTSC